MTRRRWIADEVEGDTAFLLGKNAEHLARVLRATVGQQFDIGTPEGVRRGTITRIERNRIAFSLTETVETFKPHEQPVHLYLAIFKFDRMEWAIEKCTELGATAITPVIAQRTDVHLARAAQKRVDRWKRIAHEAAQQSRREAVPEIHNSELLRDCLNQPDGTRIVLAETEQQQMLASVVPKDSPVSLAVGPEGGWTESELKLFSDHGWIAASLGPTILRAETAAIAALAITCGLQTHNRDPSW